MLNFKLFRITFRGCMCCICMEVGRDCCADIMEHVFNTDICFWHLSWVILYIFKWVWALMTTFKLVFMFFLGLGKKKKVQFVFFHLRSLSSTSFPTTILHCPGFQGQAKFCYQLHQWNDDEMLILVMKHLNCGEQFWFVAIVMLFLLE